MYYFLLTKLKHYSVACGRVSREKGGRLAGSGLAPGTYHPLITDESSARMRNEELGMRNGGAAPDPSTQFSLFCLYIIEHPTFHSAQDDEMRREYR